MTFQIARSHIQMPCWTTFQIWQTRTASPCGTSLSASSWYYIFFHSPPGLQENVWFYCINEKKEVIWIFKICFHLCFFKNSYTDTSQYSFHSVMPAPFLGMQIARVDFFSFCFPESWWYLSRISQNVGSTGNKFTACRNRQQNQPSWNQGFLRLLGG